MDAERWQLVQQVFETAVARPAPERAVFVARACAEDSELRAEVESLLAADAEAGESISGAIRAGEELLFEQPGGEVSGGAPAAVKLGRYAIEQRIGQGGFGVVYRGYDPVLRRSVAIKTCTGQDPQLRRRFFREGQIAAGLRHPNIVTVHELGVEAGVPFLVQEFLDGEDLRQLLDQGAALPLGRRLHILLQVAAGLEHAHRAGVLHRDVKPANIRVLADGTVKLLDFGIAKVLDADSQLTGEGTTLGTVGYLAPEQLKSEPLDERGDIFAFGVLAHELIAGQRPFLGEDFSQVAYQLLHVDPPPLTSLVPACPGELSRLVTGCLAKERGRRLRDFRQVLEVLEPLWRRLQDADSASEPVLAAGELGEPEAPTLIADRGATVLMPPASPEVARRVARPLGWRLALAAVAVILVAVILVAVWTIPRLSPVSPALADLPAAEPPRLESRQPAPAGAVEAGAVEAGTVEAGGVEAGGVEITSPRPVVPPPESSADLDAATGPPARSPKSAESEDSVAGTAPPESDGAPQARGPATDVERESPGSAASPDQAAREQVGPPVSVAAATVDDTGSAPSPALEQAPGGPGELASGREVGETGLEAGREAAGLSRPAAQETPSGEQDEVSLAAPGPMEVGDLIAGEGPGVEPPGLIGRPQAPYPRRARRRGLEARVVVKVLVGADGTVLQAIAPPDEHGFGEAARQAALDARFEPATRHGVAGRMWTSLPFEFKVD